MPNIPFIGIQSIFFVFIYLHKYKTGNNEHNKEDNLSSLNGKQFQLLLNFLS